jgi:hypothetical protein
LGSLWDGTNPGGRCNRLELFIVPLYGETHYFFSSVAILASTLFGDLGPGLFAKGVSALISA